MKKPKTYNIMLSSVFPVTHPKAGQETGFAPKAMAAVNNMPCYLKKLHTIRANYYLWKKRFEEVERGEAVIKLRQWTGKPYRSKTKEIKTLTAADGIGIQKLQLYDAEGEMPFTPFIDGFTMGYAYIEDGFKNLANNDGLSLEDWQAWFKGYDKAKPLAIIHFTSFRY